MQSKLCTNFQPSLLRGLRVNYSVLTSWEEMYRIITQDRWVAEQTQLFRTTHDENYKHKLPAVTTAVQLDGKGKAVENIVGYTGVTHCDLDHVPAERLTETLEKIRKDPHTLLCNVSPSGNGIHIYARYIPVTDSTDYKDCYHDAFMAMNCYYADLLVLPFDEQCSNPNKTLSLSHDPEAFFNPNAEAFVVTHTDSTDLTDCFNGTKLSTRVTEEHRNNPLNPLNPYATNTHWVKEYTDPIEFAEKYVREKQGLTYSEGYRNEYLYKCLNMMNLLGVDRTAAETWLRDFDLPSREKQSILKSAYKRTNEFGKFERPYTWKEEEVTETKKNTKTNTKDLASCTCSGIPYTRTREKHNASVNSQPLPSLPDYCWPERMQRMIDCGETPAQRDVILLSVMVVIGALMSKTLRIPYGHKSFWPNLQCFVIAPPASGKGCISWVRKLAEPLHKAMMNQWQQRMTAYRKEKAAYDIAGKQRAEMEIPVEPKMSMFLIAGNNSSTGIQENLMDAGGRALICEVEADTMSESINADYGGWSDLVRKAFEHERLAYNRRANHEYREIDTTRLSVLLSGTPAQVQPLIPSAENGLYSRQIFYNMPTVDEWINQFADDDSTNDYDQKFSQWGEEWKALQDRLDGEISMMTFSLTAEQQNVFNETFAQLFSHAVGTHDGHHAKSSVIRLAINILRMMSVVALLRALEEVHSDECLVHSVLLKPDAELQAENVKDGAVGRYTLSICEADFQAVLSLAEPLYRHAMSVLQLLPSQEAERKELSPMQHLLENLPMHFSRKFALEKAQALDIKEGTLDSQLSRLVASGRLNKSDTGEYTFSAASRVRV